MIYVLSTLLFVLGLVTGLPAIPKFLRMRKIKPNSSSTTGVVRSDIRPNLNDSTGTGMMSSILGKISHPQISYETPDKKERTIEVVESSSFQIRHYKLGDEVKVVYDKNVPGLAYLQKEWDGALRDLWLAGGELLVAVVLWSIGLFLKLPIW
jgi:hypothetical protein